MDTEALEVMIQLSKWGEHGEEFLALRAQGMSYRRIADKLPVSVTTLKAWGQKFRLEIVRLSLGRAEAFVEAHLVDIRNRLELRAEQIQRIRKELGTRDFVDVETGALLRIYVRYLESVQKDVDPLKVEVNSTMQNYEQIILRCARVVDDGVGVLPDASES